MISNFFCRLLYTCYLFFNNYTPINFKKISQRRLVLKSKVLSGCNLLGFNIFSIYLGAYLSILCVPEFTKTTRYVHLGGLKHSICVVQCDLKYISLTFWYDSFGIVIYSESSELTFTNCCLMSNMLQHVALCTIMSSEESCEVCRLAVHSLVDRQVDGQTDRQAERYVSTKSAQVWTMAHVARITGFPTQPRTTLTVGDWQGRAVPRCNTEGGTEWVNVGTVPARAVINHFWEVGRCKNLGHCVRKGAERNICVRRVRTVAQNNHWTTISHCDNNTHEKTFNLNSCPNKNKSYILLNR